MSRFSGKADFCIWCNEGDYDFANSDIYLGCGLDENYNPTGKKLDIKNKYDALPYFPHIVGIGFGSKDGRSVIYLSSRSYVDEREEEHLQWIISDIRRAFKKRKRKKQVISPELLYEDIYVWKDEENLYKKLINRFMQNHSNPDISDIHTTMSEYYRNELKDEMIKEGYSEEETIDWIWGNKKYV